MGRLRLGRTSGPAGLDGRVGRAGVDKVAVAIVASKLKGVGGVGQSEAHGGLLCIINDRGASGP